MTGKADVPLYEYNRAQTVESLLHAKFKALGFEFKEGISYSQTEGKKLYGNSTHSGLEYVTAFGKYIMPKADLPKTRGTFKGSFEYLESIYLKDKEWIESLIQTGYNLHFRNEQASGVLLADVYNGVKTAMNYVNTLEVKVKSETSKRSAVNKLQDLLKLVEKEIMEIK